MAVRDRMERNTNQCEEVATALDRSGEMLRLVLEAIPVCVHWKNLDSVYLGCNGRFAHDAELDSPEQIVGKTDFNLPWKQFAEHYQSRDRQVIETGQALERYEQPRTSSDGRIFWLRQSKLPLRDGSGKIIGVLSTYEDITEPKRIRKALLESELKYRRIVDTAQEGILMFDRELRTTFVNSRAVEMLGCPAEELLGRKMDSYLYEQDLPDHYEKVRKRVAGMPQRYERRLRRKDGQLLWTIVSATPLHDAQRRFCGSFIMLTDITEQKRAEEAMQESEARYRAVVEHSPEGIAVSVDEKLVYLNPAGLRLAGLESIDEVMGRPILDFVAGEFQPKVAERRQEMLRTLQPMPVMEGRIRRPDGSFFEAESMGVPIVYNQQLAVLNCFRDITERKRAEEAVRDSEVRYRTLFEFAQDAIFLDEGDRFVDCNAKTLEMFGGERDQIIGQTPVRFSPALQPDGRDSGEKAREKIEAAYAGTPQFFEWRHRRCDGSEFDAEVSLNRIEVGERPMLLAIVRDVTDRKRAEAALARSRDELELRVRERTAELLRANERLQELDRLKSQFLATMSHELRTPLNSIIGFTGMLRRGYAGSVNPEQEKQLGMVFGSARHLLSLINDLLDLSRIAAGKMRMERELFNFNEVVAEVMESLGLAAKQKGISLVAELPEQAIEMRSDRRRCYQVLLNLVNNAIKFTERGEVRITARSEGDKLRVCVADTGIGIRPEQMGRLFEAFRQLDDSARRMYEGTGLGLYLCKRLLSLMGGEIHAESEFGRGSRFYFAVPLQLAAEARKPEDKGSHEDTKRR